jgi:hypothetical protein
MLFRIRRLDFCFFALVSMLVAPSSTIAQDVSSTQPLSMNMPADNGWQLMQDGVLFAEFNHQGGPRGGNEFVAPNWWMGMASRETSHGRLTYTGMLSLDPATVGKDRYREIFQAGPQRTATDRSTASARPVHATRGRVATTGH